MTAMGCPIAGGGVQDWLQYHVLCSRQGYRASSFAELVFHSRCTYNIIGYSHHLHPSAMDFSTLNLF